MSQYLNFYLRTKGGEFVSLADYSRSTEVYQHASAPYEKLRKVDYSWFTELGTLLQGKIDWYRQQIQKTESIIVQVANFSDTNIEERLEYIHQYQDSIEEYQEYIKEIEFSIAEIYFMQRLSEDEEIYVGIEVGEPTDEDIERA